MTSYPLHILSRPQVPNTSCLIARARPKNRLVGWMPDSSVNCKVMLKFLLGPWLQLRGVPQANRLVKRSGEHHSFVDVVPFTAVDFSLMPLDHCKGSICWIIKVPKFYWSVTTSRQNLIWIRLIKTDVISSVRCLKRSNLLDAIHVNINQRDCAAAN